MERAGTVRGERREGWIKLSKIYLSLFLFKDVFPDYVDQNAAKYEFATESFRRTLVGVCLSQVQMRRRNKIRDIQFDNRLMCLRAYQMQKKRWAAVYNNMKQDFTTVVQPCIVSLKPPV